MHTSAVLSIPLVILSYHEKADAQPPGTSCWPRILCLASRIISGCLASQCRKLLLLILKIDLFLIKPHDNVGFGEGT